MRTVYYPIAIGILLLLSGFFALESAQGALMLDEPYLFNGVVMPEYWVPGPICRFPALPIPDYLQIGITDTVTISSTDIITDLNVSIDTSHTYVGDLVFTLQHVDTGSSATIVDRPGDPATPAGCSGNDIFATLDDEALDPIEDECTASVPTINGAFTSNNPLTVFDGESYGGTWNLHVSDEAPLDTGTLNAWCLLPNDVTPPPTPTPTATLTPTPTLTPTTTPSPTTTSTPTVTITLSTTFTPTPTQSGTPSTLPPPPDFWVYLPTILR
jgi:subtilisin-like proprotein convertase family protein